MRGGWPAKIFIGFIALYFLLFFGLAGIYLPQFALKNTGESQTVIGLASKYVLYILVADLVMRFFFQSGAGLNIKHYILRPVYFRQIIRFLLLRSLFNFFNAAMLLFIIPFTVRAVHLESGTAAAVFFLTGMFSLMLFNSLIADYLRRLFAGNLKVALIIILVITVLFSVEPVDFFTLTDVSQFIFEPVLSSPFAILAVLLPAGAFKLNVRYLEKNRYSETWRISTSKTGFLSKLEWEGKDVVSNLVSMEWKLILRHTRTRALLFFSLIFVGYGFIFYKGDIAEINPFALAFSGVVVTGFASFNYGQFLGAWEGSFFDGIFSRNINIEEYYLAKFRLLCIFSGISYFISLLYGFMDAELIISHTAFAVYNIGVNTYLILFFSGYQRTKIKLNEATVFNYQGTSALQFLVMIPFLIPPVFLFFAVSFFFGNYAGYAAVAAGGLLSAALHKFWIRGIADNFREKKYAIATGFRRKD